MKKHMFHLACSPDSLPTSDAIKPLVVFLEDKIASEIDGRLLRENYHRCLHVIWESILLVLQENAEDPSNVRKCLSMLIQFVLLSADFNFYIEIYKPSDNNEFCRKRRLPSIIDFMRQF